MLASHATMTRDVQITLFTGPIGHYQLSLMIDKVIYHVTVDVQLPHMAVFKFESGKSQLLPRAMHLPSFTNS